jgi:hypothetical protein
MDIAFPERHIGVTPFRHKVTARKALGKGNRNVRVGRLAALAVCMALVGGSLAACAPETTVAEATAVGTMKGRSAANDSRVLPAPASVQSYRSGADTIAALIRAE